MSVLATKFEGLNLADSPGAENGKKLSKKQLEKQKKMAKKLKKQQELQEIQKKNDAINSTLRNAMFQDEAGTVPRNVLEKFAPFAKIARNGLDLEIRMISKAMEEDFAADFEFCYDLTKLNMEQHYEDCGWGWNANKKKREIEDHDARILMVYDTTTSKPVAFAHFRFLREDDATVLYVYEVQVSIPRHGIGRHLMMIMELVARTYGLEWVMLTVLDTNEAAKKFYESMNYKLDETSPQCDIYEDTTDTKYEILSKRMPVKN